MWQVTEGFFGLISCWKTEMRATIWPERHLFLSCLMLGFCSHPCTSSLKTVLLLHDWWWLNLGSHPYNLHISQSPLLSQRVTNGCLLWLQAEQPSGRMLASFWAWKNSQQFNQKKKKPGLRTHKASHATRKRSSLKTQTLVKMTLAVKCFNASALAMQQVSHHIQIICSEAVWGY